MCTDLDEPRPDGLRIGVDVHGAGRLPLGPGDDLVARQSLGHLARRRPPRQLPGSVYQGVGGPEPHDATTPGTPPHDADDPPWRWADTAAKGPDQGFPLKLPGFP